MKKFKIDDILLNFKIKYKLIYSVLPFLIISYAIILYSTFFIFYNQTKSIITQQATQNIEQKTERFNTYIDKLYNMIDTITFSKSIQNGLLLNQEEMILKEKQVFIQELSENINNIMISNDKYVRTVCIRNSYDESLLLGATYDRPLNEYIQRMNKIRDKTNQQAGKLALSYDRLNVKILTATRTIYKLDATYPASEIGMILVDFDLGFFYEIARSENENKYITLVLLSDTNDVIANTTPILDEECIILGNKTSIDYNNKHYKVIKQTSTYGNWKVISVINETDLYSDLYKIFFLQIGLVLLSIFILLMAIIHFSNSISRQFNHFINKLNNTTNINANSLIEITSKDEFAELAQVYNQMMNRIDNLIKTVYAQNLLVKTAEFKAFQAQINPHFLYNTLDSINGLVELNKLDETKKTVMALANIMRMTIKGEDFMTVKLSMEYINQYLYIEKTRFQNKILFLIDVPDSMMNYVIPKLIIQPIIENAILHGVYHLLTQGMIAILGREYEDCIVFCIKDNGVGIPQSIIEKINNIHVTNVDTEKLSKKSLGLINIERRIQLLYGENYGLVIENIQQGGTSVTIRLPKIINEKESLDNENTNC